MKLHRGKRADRAGYALVLFVMMFFGLMGLAALVIDIGFVRLAQRQMQTAVDSAALEGCGFETVSSDCTRCNPTMMQLRRLRRMSERHYDPSDFMAGLDRQGTPLGSQPNGGQCLRRDLDRQR